MSVSPQGYKEEGAVRNFPPFARFLAVAGMLSGQPLNAENMAREAQAPGAR
jgi:hypothetical protein